MNKKFSTLLVSVLLASAFTANAEDAVWKQVKASELVTGGEYVITTAKGDSVMVPVNSKTNGKAAGGPRFVARKGNAVDSTWVVTKNSNGFTLKNASVQGSKGDSALVNTSNILLFGKGNGATFVLGDDGSLKIGTKYVWNNKLSNISTNSATPSEFIFWAQEKAAVETDSIAAGSTKVTDLKGANAVFVMDQDGNYVGVSGKTALRAVDAKLQAISAEDFLALNDKSRFVWLNTDKGLKSANAKADLYLTADATTGVWTTSAKEGATVEDGYLVVNGENASQISLFTSTVTTTLLPVDGLTALTSVADGSYYILMANGQVVSEDSQLTDYNEESGHKTQIWKAVVAKEGDGSYVLRFVNKNTGKYLQSSETGNEQYYQVGVNKVSDKNEYTLPAYGFQLRTATSDKYATSNFSAGTVDQALTFGVATVQDRMISIDELKSVYGASFGVTVKRAAGEKALVNNPFTGKLAPVTKVKVKSGYYLDAPAGTYMLQKENGNLIAVSPEKYANKTDATYGYKVVEISPKDLYLALADKKYYAYGFQLYAPGSTFVGEDATASYILAKSTNPDEDAVNDFRLGALQVSGVGIALSAEEGNGYEFTDALQIKLGTFTKIDLTELLAKPSFYQVTVKNVNKNSSNYGTVLGLNASGNTEYVKASEALVGYPEAQWAIKPDVDEGTITFINRENKDNDYSLNVDEIYTTDKENVFSVPNSYKSWDGTVYAWRDTIEIKPVATAETDGYLHMAVSEWKNNLYYVGMNSPVWKGLAYMTENHKDEHKLGLDIDKENATKWELASAWSYTENALGEITGNAENTYNVGHTLYYWNASKGEFVDTDKDGKQTVWLKIPVYKFTNSANGEEMYEGDVVKLTTGTTGEHFALKEVAEGKYNLVAYYVNPNTDAITNHARKVYGGSSAEKGLLGITGMYNRTENDIFSIEVAEAPEYVKLNYGDKIKIYRDEQESNVLYEKGEFAGIGNAVEFANINPALYVDTAWMNRDEVVNRYDYLLAVNAKQATKAYECNVPEHKHLYHYADTTYGRFLVNLADSAIVEDERDSHNNKFVYEARDRYAKLGFVEAKHTGDKLIIASPKDTIEVGTPAYNLVKFAFRTVDPEAGTFVIETGYKWPYEGQELDENPGYLRWINGNLVVTDDVADAEVFSLKATENEATANEAIAAEGVQVIGGKGAVTVQGAAGKVITVANVLGQTIANQVAASDNVTIAAPAGIVVVAVEGEATKVVVK